MRIVFLCIFFCFGETALFATEKKELLLIAKKVFQDKDLHIVAKTFFISKTQKKCMTRLQSFEDPSSLFSYYMIFKNKINIGYILVKTHRVRALYEKIALFFDTNIFVRGIKILEFYEPKQYKAPIRWLRQFIRNARWITQENPKSIHVLSGATLTADAIKREVMHSSVSLECLFLDKTLK